MSGQCFRPRGRHLAGGNIHITADSLATVSQRNIHQITSAHRDCFALTFDLKGGLTCNETGHLSGVGVVSDPPSGGAHVHLERVEGQQVPVVVPELGVDPQQAAVVGEVAEVERQLLLRAVHLAEVQEGRQGVDLLPLIGFPTKIVGRVSGSTDRGGPEGGDAVVRAVGEARVARRDLSENRNREVTGGHL